MNHLLALDTGIKSRFTVVIDGDHKLTRTNWDWLIGECEKVLPGFEGDHILIDSPIARLEQINLGSLVKNLSKEKKDLIANCFPHPLSLYHVMEKFRAGYLSGNLQRENQSIDFLSREILRTSNSLKYTLLHSISREDLITQSIDWRRKYPFHQHAKILKKNLKQWEKSLKKGDKGYAFELLIRDLAWHTLMMNEWLVDKNLKEIPFETICQYEQDVALRLLYYYLEQIKDGANLSGTLLFSRLERLGTHWKFPASKKEWDSRPNNFKRDRELLDSDLTEFLVTGYALNKKRRPLIIVTCEQRGHTERLLAHIRGINFVNDLLDSKESKEISEDQIPPRIPINPGKLVIIDQHKSKPTELIDVKELLSIGQ